MDFCEVLFINIGNAHSAIADIFKMLIKRRKKLVEAIKIRTSFVRDLLSEKDIVLTYSDQALRLIAEKSFSAKFGARNMRRFIQTEVEDKLAEIIIADYNRAFTVAEIFAENGEIKVTCK